MSEFKHILRLEPPRYSNHEDLQGEAIACPFCGGNGFFWGEDPRTTESVKNKCTYCDGTTRLVPYVHVRWGAPLVEITESIHNLKDNDNERNEKSTEDCAGGSMDSGRSDGNDGLS